MSLAGVALQALSVAAPRIPDRVFELIPGGYYKAADEVNQADRKHASKPSRKKGRSHHAHDKKGRGHSEDGRRLHQHPRHRSPRRYESDLDYSATDDNADEGAWLEPPLRSSGRKPARLRARSVDARYGQPLRAGGYPPEHRHQSIAESASDLPASFEPVLPGASVPTSQGPYGPVSEGHHGTYGPYSSTSYSPHRQGCSSPVGSHPVPGSVAPRYPRYQRAAQPLTGQAATPYIPYSDIYGSGDEHRRIQHGTSPSGGLATPPSTVVPPTSYTTNTRSRQRSSMPPMGYGGSRRRRSAAPPVEDVRSSWLPATSIATPGGRSWANTTNEPLEHEALASGLPMNGVHSQAAAAYTPSPPPVGYGPSIPGYPYATGAPVPPSTDTPPRSIDRYRHRKDPGHLAQQLDHLRLDTQVAPAGSQVRDGSPWSAGRVSRGDVWEREVDDGVRSRSGIRRRDRSRNEGSDLESGRPDNGDDRRTRGRRRRRKVRLQVDGEGSGDDALFLARTACD